MKKLMTLLLAALALLALPVVATAAPGGNAGVDEYTETFPGAGGNKPSRGGGGRSGGSDGGSLTPAQVAALESQGADGAAAAELAQATGEPAGKNRRGDGTGGSDRNGGAAGGSGDGTSAASEGSGLPGVIGDLAGGDDSGMGLVLPIILAAALIGAIAFVLARRGGGSTGPA